MTHLGISIVNYHCAELVGRMAASFEGHIGDLRVDLVCVDNSCDDDEAMRLARALGDTPFATSEVLSTAANVGYGAAHNRGIRRLIERGCDVIAIANPDINFESGELRAFAERVASAEPPVLAGVTTIGNGTRSSGVSAISLVSTQSTRLSAGAVHKPGRLQARYPDGHWIAATSTTWTLLDGFDEHYFLYFEEVDLAERGRRLGVRIVAFDEMTVAHIGASTTAGSEGEKSDLTRFHSSRSGAIYFRRYHPLLLITAMAARISVATASLLRGAPRSAGATIRGLFAGMRAPSRRFSKAAR